MSIRRTIGISILLLLAAVSHASIIECVGTATQVVNGNDTLFIFKDEIHLHSTIGNVTWYDAVAYCNALSLQEGLTPCYTISGTTITWNLNANGYRLMD